MILHYPLVFQVQSRDFESANTLIAPAMRYLIDHIRNNINYEFIFKQETDYSATREALLQGNLQVFPFFIVIRNYSFLD